MRPIGIGECFRRFIGKTVTKKYRVTLEAKAGPLQLAAGRLAGAEAAVHATNHLLENENTDGILLVDAENAFNLLNRRVALHNIQIMCPIVASFAINIYRHSNRLFTATAEITGDEGVTQGDPFAMVFYGISVRPLIYNRNTECNVAWFADDSTGGGKLQQLKQWWDFLTEYG